MDQINFTLNRHPPLGRLESFALNSLSNLSDTCPTASQVPKIPQGKWSTWQSSSVYYHQGFDFRCSNLCFKINQKGKRFKAHSER